MPLYYRDQHALCRYLYQWSCASSLLHLEYRVSLSTSRTPDFQNYLVLEGFVALCVSAKRRPVSYWTEGTKTLGCKNGWKFLALELSPPASHFLSSVIIIMQQTKTPPCTTTSVLFCFQKINWSFRRCHMPPRPEIKTRRQEPGWYPPLRRIKIYIFHHIPATQHFCRILNRFKRLS